MKPSMATEEQRRRRLEHQRRLEQAGFRVVSDQEEQIERANAGYPPGHCWHLVPRHDTDPPTER